MSFSILFYDILRRTQSKTLIAVFGFIIIGKLSPRYKLIKAYKDYSFKEVDERRKSVFQMMNKNNNKKL